MSSLEESSWKEQLVCALLKPPPTEAKPTIRQAPAKLRSISPDDFQPKVLYLGLHDRRQYSDGCEDLKVALAQALLPPQHDPPAQGESQWNKVVSEVVRSPKEARQQYERRCGTAEEGYLDTNNMDDDAVATMLALDAVCVVAFLQVFSLRQCFIPRWDVVFREPRWWGLMNQMKTDLAMVQNQVPMSCLKGAVWVALDSGVGATEGTVVEELEKLLRHAVCFLHPLAHDKELLLRFMETTFCGSNALVHCKHILDCLYLVLTQNLPFPPAESHEAQGTELQSLVDSPPHDPGSGDPCALTASQGPAMSACRLKASGIKVCSRPCRLSEISFTDRILWSSQLLLPQLLLYDTTAAELRNLAVYEFEEYPWHGHVRLYMRFINDLVSDAADAELLVDSEAILNHVGGFEEIVSIWSGLNQGISPPGGHEKTSVVVAKTGIRKHCRNPRRLCMENICKNWESALAFVICGLFTLAAVIFFVIFFTIFYNNFSNFNNDFSNFNKNKNKIYHL